MRFAGARPSSSRAGDYISAGKRAASFVKEALLPSRSRLRRIDVRICRSPFLATEGEADLPRRWAAGIIPFGGLAR